MAMWPKTIYVGGIGIPVADWDEMDELIRRYGSAAVSRGTPESGDDPRIPTPPAKNGAAQGLSAADHSLLERFVARGDKGVPTSEIGPALGKKGKSIRGELDVWSRKIGLVNQAGASAFESLRGSLGRGFRLVGVYQNAARRILES